MSRHSAARPPSLRAIAAFEAAARHESFTKAAIELNLTQSAVSHAVLGLERRLGAKLFSRERGRLILTEAGRVLAGHVRLSLQLLTAAFDKDPWIDKDKLQISALPILARRILAPRLPQLFEAFPGVTFHIATSAKLEEIGAVHDVGLRYGPGSWAGLAANKLASEIHIAVAAASYAKTLPKDPRDLAGHRLLAHADFSWTAWLGAINVPASVVRSELLFDDADSLIEAVVAGAGIGLVRGLMAANELKQGRLIRAFEMEQLAQYSYWLVWNPASPKLGLIQKFARWLSTQFSDMLS